MQHGQRRLRGGDGIGSWTTGSRCEIGISSVGQVVGANQGVLFECLLVSHMGIPADLKDRSLFRHYNNADIGGERPRVVLEVVRYLPRVRSHAHPRGRFCL